MARLIGTAGHVDHGKTSLIQALTGTDTDRLPEEKRRGLTIDIGFAALELPVTGRVSIVDVPGHERFLGNMLVGALGTDVVLLCIASDESVMPQTREHLAILELLPAQRLVIAFTKVDLADAETRALLLGEAAELLAETRFAGSPVVFVSAKTGEGLDELRVVLDAALEQDEDDSDLPWYLPVDRVFAVKGHGVVVTGTMMQGRVGPGDEAELLPRGVPVRIRQVQIHGKSCPLAERGQRTALNLGGVREEDVSRGMVVGAPGTVWETQVISGTARWKSDVSRGDRIRLAIGADEVIGRAFPGEDGTVQFRLERPTAAVKGQPYIVRRFSPPDLLGGGRVVVARATKGQSEGVAALDRPMDIDQAVRDVAGTATEGVSTEDVCRVVGRSAQVLGEVFERLTDLGDILGFAGLWFTPERLEEGFEKFESALAAAHAAQPTALMVPREAVVRASGLGWQGKALDRIIAAGVANGRLRASGTLVGLSSIRARLNPRQRELLDRLAGALDAAGALPPNRAELAPTLGIPRQAVDEIVRVGIDAGELLVVNTELVMTPGGIEAIVGRVRSHFGTGSFTVAEFRDALGTSRKYAVPILEYLDARGRTLRQGDSRIVR